VDPLDATVLDGLLDPSSTPCVSMFLPGYRAITSGNPGRIQLKNLIGVAEGELQERGLRRPAAAEVLAPARKLLDNDDFWQHRQNGLAVFLSPGYSRCLWLPIEPLESLTVAGRFKLRPLLSALWPDQRFYVLAISQDGHRLFKGSRWRFDQIPLNEAPRTMKAMLAAQGLQMEMTTRPGASRPRQQGGVAFHGHGVESGVCDERELEYFRQVDRSVTDVIQHDPGPLVIAATSEQIAAYRDVSASQHILEQGIEGNSDGTAAEDLHDKAWPLIRSTVCDIQQQAIDRYREQAGHGRAAAGPKVLEAAYQGRVDSLFLSEENGLYWGRFDVTNGEVDVNEPAQPGDDDLLDLAAAYTLSRGGRVFVLPRERMPEGRALAALLRF
jgi:hypothetical protein